MKLSGLSAFDASICLVSGRACRAQSFDYAGLHMSLSQRTLALAGTKGA